ncbi:MAG: universal stress protein [Acidimicrobiia bacterium]
MHVLIATTGVLSPDPAVEFSGKLIRGGGKVTVTTVIEVPRSFLDALRSEGWHPLDEAHGTGPAADDALLARYVEERGRRLTDPIVTALKAAGIEAKAIFREGDDPARAISQLADEVAADVVVLGATRKIFDQSAWESVSARIMIESGRPVLVLPPPQRDTVPNDTDAS